MQDAHTPRTPKPQPFLVRVPGFLTDREVGLGELVTHATSAIGIRPCGGCGKRAQLLNSIVVFSGQHRD
jgi:hypothetical protein